MERYLVIWCPDLLEPKEQGREQRAFCRVVEAVSSLATRVETVRPGVCAVPTRGPSRYFGGDLSLCEEVTGAVEREVPGTQTGLGVADGLFAAMLAARSGGSGAGGPAGGSGAGGSGAGGSGAGGVVVPPGGTTAFLSPWPVGVLERVELADLLIRLGIRTLGRFAALPARHVLARFGTDGAACHLVAAGRSGELPGLRAGPLAGTGLAKQAAPVVRQPGFWGGSAESEKRASAVLARLQRDLGPEEVVAARLQGGRDPSERAFLVPVDSRAVGTTREHHSHHPHRRAGNDAGNDPGNGNGNDGPWPGRLPPPSPAVVLARPLPVTITDQAGAPVLVSARVLLSAAPAEVSVAGEPFTAVTGWAGPWPADDRWWSPTHRRRARLQVVTASGSAQLLVAEGGGWWLEGIYD
jgi:hypothetical protein